MDSTSTSPVSPSLIQAERVARASATAATAAARQRRRRPDRSTKRKLEDAMGDLDDLAGTGQLSSRAYDVLAKRLKGAHDADEARTARIRRKMAIEYACSVPFTLCWAPDDVEWFTTGFVGELVRAKRVAIAKQPAGNADRDAAARAAADHANKLAFDAWLGELVEHFVGSNTDTGLDGTCRRNALLLLLETDADLFGPSVLHHLETDLTNWSADDIFEDEPELRYYALEMAPLLLPWMLNGLDPEDDDDRETIECLTEAAEMGG